MTRTSDFGYPVDNHSSLDTTRMNPPTHTVGDLNSMALWSFVGWFIGKIKD
jgi:hypothetical protein